MPPPGHGKVFTQEGDGADRGLEAQPEATQIYNTNCPFCQINLGADSRPILAEAEGWFAVEGAELRPGSHREIVIASRSHQDPGSITEETLAIGRVVEMLADRGDLGAFGPDRKAIIYSSTSSKFDHDHWTIVISEAGQQPRVTNAPIPPAGVPAHEHIAPGAA